MTNPEILNQFDVLYNNIMSDQAPGLDGYEKSVFWNKATLEVLKNHLNPKGNKYTEGFDNSSKRQVEFSDIVITYDLEFPVNMTTGGYSGIGYVGTEWMSNPLSILNERIDVITKEQYEALSDLSDLTIKPESRVVVPINYIEADTLLSRPYKYPPKSQAWRMLVDGKPEFIVAPTEVPVCYHARYVKIPAEVNLESNVSSEVPEVLHDEILQRAVELAKNAWEGNIETAKAFGERSE